MLFISSFSLFMTLNSSLDFFASGHLVMLSQSSVLYSKLNSCAFSSSSCISLVSACLNVSDTCSMLAVRVIGVISLASLMFSSPSSVAPPWIAFLFLAGSDMVLVPRICVVVCFYLILAAPSSLARM